MSKRKFVKKPIVIEAFQFGVDTVPNWFKAKYITIENGEATACIETLEGDMLFHNGDYVIKKLTEGFINRQSEKDRTYYTKRLESQPSYGWSLQPHPSQIGRQPRLLHEIHRW